MSENSKSPLRIKFEKCLKIRKKQKPKDSETLLGGLMFYGASVPAPKNMTLWQILEEQINFQATRYGCTPEEFLHYLFDSKDYDVFMGRLQI